MSATASHPPRVLLLGGAGFLGYHATLQFLQRGYEVTILALPPPPEPGLFPVQAKTVFKDVNTILDRELLALLTGQEAIVFAAGADDRLLPHRPSWPFFYKHNVETAAHFFRLARQAGVKRGVLLSSYFAHFARIWPELHLAQHHPYIRSRVEQEQAVLDAAGDMTRFAANRDRVPSLSVVILELPYIFGAMPGRRPLWTPLLKYINSTPVIFYPRGGTNMIAVDHVAEAIAGAVERGRPGTRYLVGDENLTWVEFLHRLSRAMGKEKPVVTLPDILLRSGLRLVRMLHHIKGREGGLDPVHLLKLQTANTFFDPEPSRQALGYGQGGLDQAFAATVRAALGR